MMINKLMSLFKDEDGATMVEYALMLALIAIICIVAVSLVGQRARDKFNSIADCLS